jgi:hypothetical protein
MLLRFSQQHDFGANGQENEPRVSLRQSCESMVLDYWYYPPNPPTRGDFGQSAFRHEIQQSRNYFSPASYQSSWQFWVSNMSKITKEFLLKRMKKKMKPSPSHWTGTDHLNAALEEAGCKTPDEMMKAFHRASKLFFRY